MEQTATPQVQFLLEEVQDPKILTLENLQALEKGYFDNEAQLLFQRAAADSLVARGCALAIGGLIRAAYGAPEPPEDDGA